MISDAVEQANAGALAACPVPDRALDEVLADG